MTDRDAWTARLWLAAPGAGWPLLRVLATVLAADPAPDLVLLVGDVLAAAGHEAQAYGNARVAGELDALADLVRANVRPARTAEVLPFRI